MMREFVVDIREVRELSCTVWAEDAESAESAAWDKYNGGNVSVVKSSEEITNVTEYA